MSNFSLFQPFPAARSSPLSAAWKSVSHPDRANPEIQRARGFLDPCAEERSAPHFPIFMLVTLFLSLWSGSKGVPCKKHRREKNSPRKSPPCFRRKRRARGRSGGTLGTRGVRRRLFHLAKRQRQSDRIHPSQAGCAAATQARVDSGHRKRRDGLSRDRTPD